MTVFITILLTVTTFAFIAYPLFRQKAISITKDADTSETDTEVDEEIEKEIAELRRAKARFCSQCGTGYQEGDSFCSQCGTEIKRGERID